MLVPLTLWLLLIFYTLAVAADAFFCPAVDVISDALKLPPDVAGATLLSFGNGAPDVFTQVAAITHGASSGRGWAGVVGVWYRVSFVHWGEGIWLLPSRRVPTRRRAQE